MSRLVDGFGHHFFFVSLVWLLRLHFSRTEFAIFFNNAFFFPFFRELVFQR
jgi:hypothetical protein